jgi:SAM-dependent methyltransferase
MWEPGPLRKLVRTYLLERTLWRLPRDGSVLDLCCGHGFYFSINPRAAGIDADPRAIEQLSKRGHDVRLGNVLEGLPYPDAQFSWVVAHDVLEHFTIQELERLVPEVHRVLGPGGRFLVLVPNRKGFDYGVRMRVGHRLFVTEREVRQLARERFEVEASYTEPLPRWLGRFFTHNKEVFRLRKV